MKIGPISPFFIVSDVLAATQFYESKLGFKTTALLPVDEPFFARVAIDDVSIFLKAVSEEIEPLPNCSRHSWAPWDAFVLVDNPDALLEKYLQNGCSPLKHAHLREDGLYGFEIQDVDGYILFFGRLA